MIGFKRSLRWWALALSVLMIGEILMSVPVYAQTGREPISDLEGRKRMYAELKIDVGDAVYNELRDEAIADAILVSKFASDQTKSLARKFKDGHLLNQILIAASWMVPVLYRVEAELAVRASAPNFPSDDVINLLQYSAIGFLIIGGASIVVLKIFRPRLPVTVVEAYNEDVRKGLNLSEADVLGL